MPTLKQIVKVALSITFFISISLISAAQTITPEMLDKAKKAGYSQEQIKAAMGGMQLQSSKTTNNTDSKITKETTKEITRELPSDSLDAIYRLKFRMQDSLRVDSLKKANAVFGHEIFSSKELSFIPNFNVATPKNYKLGAGDELIINIYGNSEQNYTQKISPDGRIVIPNLGPVSLLGLTIEGAESRLKHALSKIYSGLNGGGTHLTLSLGNIRSIKVNIVGEVVIPGTYTLPSLATLFNAIYAAGGVNEIGSLRSIKVYRNSQMVGNLDVYDYLLNGKFDSNVRLEDNDMIVVSPYESIVEITGMVKRPRRFELKKGETLSDILRFAGDFTASAYSQNVRINRSNGRNLEVHTVYNDDFGSFLMRDGDAVIVDKIILSYSNKVEIKGAVQRPGVYALGERISTLKQLLDVAEGIRSDAFLTRTQISRTLPDSSHQMIAVDLYALVNGSGNDVTLQNKDVVFVPSIYELQEKLTVNIRGEVAHPDSSYQYKKGMTVEDLIIEAGGLTQAASMQRVEISRRIRDPYSLKPSDEAAHVYVISLDENLAVVDGDKNFALEPFDEVVIRKSPVYKPQQKVTVMGEVVFGGEFSLATRGQRLSEVVNMAGLTDQAYIKGARLTRIMDHDDSLRVITLLKLVAQQNGKDSIDMNKLDVGKEFFVGIDLPAALANPGSEADVVLKDGDVINVPLFNNTVKISGTVLYPNTVTYSKKKNLKDYVDMAGGYGYRAKKKKAFVIYMNGNVARGRSSKIEPGCEIVIPSKPNRKGMSAGEIMGISSSTASVAAMIATLVNALK